jgi:hypothetical protein
VDLAALPAQQAAISGVLDKRVLELVDRISLTASQLFVAWMLRHLLRNRDIAGGFLRAQ